jgi:hypothetical protein
MIIVAWVSVIGRNFVGEMADKRKNFKFRTMDKQLGASDQISTGGSLLPVLIRVDSTLSFPEQVLDVEITVEVQFAIPYDCQSGPRSADSK